MLEVISGMENKMREAWVPRRGETNFLFLFFSFLYFFFSGGIYKNLYFPFITYVVVLIFTYISVEMYGQNPYVFL